MTRLGIGLTMVMALVVAACSSFNSEAFIRETMEMITPTQMTGAKPCPQTGGPTDSETFAAGQAGELSSGNHRFVVPAGAIQTPVTLRMVAPPGGVRGVIIKPQNGGSYQFNAPYPTLEIDASGCPGPSVIRQITGADTMSLPTEPTDGGGRFSASVRHLSLFLLAQP